MAGKPLREWWGTFAGMAGKPLREWRGNLCGNDGETFAGMAGTFAGMAGTHDCVVIDLSLSFPRRRESIKAHQS